MQWLLYYSLNVIKCLGGFSPGNKGGAWLHWQFSFVAEYGVGFAFDSDFLKQ